MHKDGGGERVACLPAVRGALRTSGQVHLWVKDTGVTRGPRWCSASNDAACVFPFNQPNHCNGPRGGSSLEAPGNCVSKPESFSCDANGPLQRRAGGRGCPVLWRGRGGDEAGQRLRSAGHRARTPPTPVSFVTTSRGRFVPRSKRLALRNTAARRRTPAGNSILRSVPRKPQTTRES